MRAVFQAWVRLTYSDVVRLRSVLDAEPSLSAHKEVIPQDTLTLDYRFDLEYCERMRHRAAVFARLLRDPKVKLLEANPEGLVHCSAALAELSRSIDDLEQALEERGFRALETSP